MDHKFITCTGFGGTGSSVISDLMKEFRNVKSCGADFEMTIAFDYGGVSDLQHYLVDDLERNKASEGIFLFQKYISYRKKKYEAHFGYYFSNIMEEYLKSLIKVEWQGENYMHYFRYNKLQRWLYYYIPQKIQRRLRQMFPVKDTYERTDIIKKYLPMQFPVTEDKFFSETKSMFRQLLDSFDKENKYEHLCFDQLVPVYNFKRYLKYFPNMRVVVIDRDPRDLYLLNELYWHEGWIPSHDVDVYIEWFQEIRRNLLRDIEEADGNVLLIKFEDCIYHYDSTISRIMDFLSLKLDDHIFRQKFFDPKKSIVNTKLWEKDSTKSVQINQIENRLSRYCYQA